MSYTEINRKYISKTRKPHLCEWCGTSIDVGSESWYRFYEFDGETRSAWMHTECTAACHRAYADPLQDMQDGWEYGDYDRGEYISRQDWRYPLRSTWQILRQIDVFDKVVVGDRIYSSIVPDRIRSIEGISSLSDRFLVFTDEHDLEYLLDRDEWVLNDWHKQEVGNAKG